MIYVAALAAYAVLWSFARLVEASVVGRGAGRTRSVGESPLGEERPTGPDLW